VNSNIYVLESYRDHFSSKDRKIEIPKQTVHIGKEAFKDNTKLAKVTIHQKVKKIGKSSFEGCENLQRVKLFGESELVVIPEKCFKDCSSLQSFVIPKEVGVIKKYAFKGCTSIKHIIIPEHIIAIEAGAFDKWTKNQTIEMYSNFKFGIVCKAKIINHALDMEEMPEDEVYETEDGRYMYSVLCKCGHVGRHRYMPIQFPIIAETKKEAAKIARKIPRVKHDHKDAILEVRQISITEYQSLIRTNNEDPYLKFKSSYQQKPYKDMIESRTVLENR